MKYLISMFLVLIMILFLNFLDKMIFSEHERRKISLEQNYFLKSIIVGSVSSTPRKGNLPYNKLMVHFDFTDIQDPDSTYFFIKGQIGNILV